MANNFPTDDNRQPPKKPVTVILKQERGGTLDLCGNKITATNADEVGIFNFNNTTDYTGQGSGGYTTVPKSGRNIKDNEINAQGGRGVGFRDFDNYTLHKNSNDKDDAVAEGKRAPLSSALASNKKSPDHKNSKDEDDAAASRKKKSPEYDAGQLAPPNPHSRSLLLVPIALAFIVAVAAYLG